MATPLKPILVPMPEPGAYNHDRPAGKLLLSQAAHFREALIQHLDDLMAVVAIDLRTLKTEGEVSAYIHKATAMLHTHGRRPRRKGRES